MLARIRKSVQEKDAGFTLVELLVVMIIIGILAAIAIPVFLNQRAKANDTSIKSDLRSISQEMETRFVDSQSYNKPTIAANSDAKTLFSNNRFGASNNLVVVKASDTGYCLRGSADASNAKGAATYSSTGLYFWVDSANGGLISGPPQAAYAAGACA